MTDEIWTLDWPQGRFSLHARSGMLDGLELELADGRRLEPLYRAPWLEEQDHGASGVLANLRGEYTCLPWGGTTPGQSPQDLPGAGLAPEDMQLHGWLANGRWSLASRSERHLTIALDFPEGNALARAERSITVLDGAAGIESSLVIEARRACRRSVAFHPSFALPATAGAVVIEPGSYAFGLTIPAGADLAHSRLPPGVRFASLSEVPLATGGSAAFDRVPLSEPAEEILMLCGSDGRIALADHANRVRWQLDWDPALLPSAALWMSNLGRTRAPWNGRNLCLGVEPCAASFGGILDSLGDNPVTRGGVASALEFEPGKPVRIGYRLTGAPL